MDAARDSQTPCSAEAPCCAGTPGRAKAGERLHRRAVALAAATIGFNLLEGFASVHYGVAEKSVALWGFGFDSFVEVGSALVVLWRLTAGPSGGARRERKALEAIAILFLFLALGIALGASASLMARRPPSSTLPGLVIALISLGAMAFLWRAKLKVALALDSAALKGDAACSRACMVLGAVLLAGSAAAALAPALWWADSAAALVLAGLVGREGWGMRQAARRGETGCGCH